ncbi:hypothetical protein F5X68DRAFT_123524, partial [Plectosphaerella plurivora]
LLEYLIVLLLFTGRGPPRGPDLLYLRYYNTGPVERSIFIHEGSLVYLTRSYKAKRLTNREFYVARFLPPVVGEILYLYLTAIR